MKKVLIGLFILISTIGYSQSSDAQLSAQSDIIKNETVAGANTKTRIAAMIQALIDSKVSIQTPRLGLTSTNGYVWTANGTGGLGSWQPASGGSGGGGGGFKVQSATPTDTTVVWIDKGNPYAGMYPVRRYVSGAYQAITPGLDYFDPIGGVISRGRPYIFAVWGQSNTGVATYNDYLNPTTGDVAKDNHIALWNADANTWAVPDYSAQPTGGTTNYWSWNLNNYGANNIQTFAKLLTKKTGRAVRIVQWRLGGTGLAYWEPGGIAPLAPGYISLTAALSAALTHSEILDGIIGIHGESGLADGAHTSIYSTYKESLFKGIMAGLRSQSYANERTAFIMPSSSISMMKYPISSLDYSEYAIRSLSEGANTANMWAQIHHVKSIQVPALGSTTSATSINLATAAYPVSLTVATGLPLTTGNYQVVVISRSNPNNFFLGSVSSYTSGTGALVLGALSFPTGHQAFNGKGTHTDWDVLPQDYLHQTPRDQINSGRAIFKAFDNYINGYRKPNTIIEDLDSASNMSQRIITNPIVDNTRVIYARASTTGNILTNEYISAAGGAAATGKEYYVSDQYSAGAARVFAATNNTLGEPTIADEVMRETGWGVQLSKPLYFSRAGNTVDAFNAYITKNTTSGITYHTGNPGGSARSHLFTDATNVNLFEIDPVSGTVINHMNKLSLSNPALTFKYTFVGGAIVANRNITLPLLTGNDVMVTEAFPQTLTNKQINGAKLETSSTVGYVPTATGTDGSWSWQASIAGFSNPMTTTGDLILGGASGVAGRLAIGANNTYLKSNGTTASWAALSAGTINSLTAASATNNIDNADFQQTWTWNSLTSNSGLSLTSSSTGAAGNTNAILNVVSTGANATSTQTTYGAKFNNTKTGTGSVNVGASFSASGGSSNYAATFPLGSVGIGVNPASILDVSQNTNGPADISIRNPNAGTLNISRVVFDNAGAVGTIGRYPSNYSTAGFQSSLVLREDVGDIVFYTNGENFHFKQSGVFNAGGKIYVGSISTTPTAKLHLAAGSASANTSPLKFTSGTNLTTAETGAMEYNGTDLLFTPVGTNRLTVFTGYMGQTTLVTGTKAVTVNGVTTGSFCVVTLVTPTGTTLTTSYQCVCTANTITIQANVAAGTINTADGSVINYMVKQ